MIWAKKTFQRGDYGSDFDRFERLFNALNGPKEMMMIVANRDDMAGQDVFICVPSRSSLSSFEGFQETAATSLPERASALICHQDEFEKRFKLPSER